MKLADAKALALDLLIQHGLEMTGFQFDNGRRRLGYYSPSKDYISLSRHYTRLNDEAVVRDVILHEIAHALTWRQGSKGHGVVWRSIARRIGANPERCSDVSKLVQPESPWIGTCADCPIEVKRFKRPKLIVQRHIPCRRKANRGLVTWTHKSGLVIRGTDVFAGAVRAIVEACEPKKEKP